MQEEQLWTELFESFVQQLSQLCVAKITLSNTSLQVSGNSHRQKGNAFSGDKTLKGR